MLRSNNKQSGVIHVEKPEERKGKSAVESRPIREKEGKPIKPRMKE